MLLEVLNICVLQPALDSHRNSTLIRRLFDKRGDVYSRAIFFFKYILFKIYLSENNLIHTHV